MAESDYFVGFCFVFVFFLKQKERGWDMEGVLTQGEVGRLLDSGPTKPQGSQPSSRVAPGPVIAQGGSQLS